MLCGHRYIWMSVCYASSMSLAAESPVHSSRSSDEFAALLDAELELASSDTSPGEDQENAEEEDDFSGAEG